MVAALTIVGVVVAICALLFGHGLISGWKENRKKKREEEQQINRLIRMIDQDIQKIDQLLEK